VKAVLTVFGLVFSRIGEKPPHVDGSVSPVEAVERGQTGNDNGSVASQAASRMPFYGRYSVNLKFDQYLSCMYPPRGLSLQTRTSTPTQETYCPFQPENTVSVHYQPAYLHICTKKYKSKQFRMKKQFSQKIKLG
jgi:hypothetical protein